MRAVIRIQIGVSVAPNPPKLCLIFFKLKLLENYIEFRCIDRYQSWTYFILENQKNAIPV